MKKLLALLFLFGIVGCGPSSDEMERIAAVTCSIIKETNDFQSSERVEKINEAREKIKLPPYLDGDEEIIRSINFNTCELLVKNDKSYFEKTNELEKLYYAEEERLAILAEQERLKKEEEERQKIKERKDKNKETLEKITPPKFVKFSNNRLECNGMEPVGDNNPLVICFEINNFKGFEVTWEVKFKNGYTHIIDETIIIPSITIYDFHLDDKTLIDLENANSLKDHVDEVNIYMTGINTAYIDNNNLLASEIRALSNAPFDILEYSSETLGIKYQIYPSP